MEIHTLRYFIAASEENSFTTAARRLGISQPALSKSMTELEEEMGLRLFVRNSRGTALTDAGRTLYDRAREIVAMTDRTVTEVRSSAQAEGCDVFAGLGESPDIEDVSECFGKVSEELPGSRLHVFTDNIEGILAKMDMGFIDFGVAIGDYDRGRYEGFPTGRGTCYGIMMREDDPLSEKSSIGRSDLEGRRIINLRGSERHRGLSELFGDRIAKGTAASYNLINNASGMVRGGVGIAVTLGWLMESTDSTGLCFRPLEPLVPVGTSIVWLKGRKLSVTAAAMIDSLREMSEKRMGD